MDHTQAQILMTAAACLMLALILSLTRNASRRKVRNTVSVDLDCNVTEAREGIRQLTADVERLHGQVKAARKDLAALKADESLEDLAARITAENRHSVAWKVTTEPARRQQPPRKSPPAPMPNAAPQKKRAR